MKRKQNTSQPEHRHIWSFRWSLSLCRKTSPDGHQVARQLQMVIMSHQSPILAARVCTVIVTFSDPCITKVKFDQSLMSTTQLTFIRGNNRLPQNHRVCLKWEILDFQTSCPYTSYFVLCHKCV